MARSSAGPVSAEVKLGEELAQLQQSASLVADHLRSSNRAFYKHLATLYLWWRDASAIDGYLDAAYATTGKRKRSIKKGINFAPLFWLAWGHNNDLSDDKAGRWSRVLNALHSTYESEAQYRDGSGCPNTELASISGALRV